MTPTLIILTTVVAWGLLVVVLVTQVFLAVLLVRENRRLVLGASIHERHAALSAALSGLRKEHINLVELVESFAGRESVRAGRVRKSKEKEKQPDAEEQSEFDLPADVLFPTVAARRAVNE